MENTMQKLILLSLIILCQGSFGAWETKSYFGSDVHLYFPKGHTSSKSYPLMINLHGCAQKGSILRDHGNWPSAADTFGVIVAVPEVPRGGVIAGCWDYYGLNHTRSNRHNGFVIDLTEKLITELSIDEDQVFVSGLSSGGGLSLVLGCLAPDIFSGLGLNAGPSVGTSSGQISRATITREQVIANCRQLAGEKARYFNSQIASIIYGNNDFLVDPNYNRINGEALSQIYGSDGSESFNPEVFPGKNSAGFGTLSLVRKSPVVSIIENTGLGHNWPAGQGGSSRSFVNKNSLDYPYYLLQFLTTNNRRP